MISHTQSTISHLPTYGISYAKCTDPRDDFILTNSKVKGKNHCDNMSVLVLYQSGQCDVVN